MNDDQIKHMVDRFLSYHFPEDIHPDGGLSIRRVFNEGTPHEFKATPSGTNLLDAYQATAMVRHMLEGLPALQGDGWRDIASAPRDGKTIVLWSKFHDEPVTAAWANGRWTARWDDCSVIESQGDTWTDYKLADVPTHWRPLPPPPGEKP